MIALHSLRTDRFRPALESVGGPGLIQPMLRIMGLSAHTISQHFKEFCLVTDDAGAEMARKCMLPYTDIISVGENFDSDPCFWTHSKFVAYASDRPFVHFDNDLFLWDPLPNRLLEADVFAFSPETLRWLMYSKYIKLLDHSMQLDGLHKKHFTNRVPVNMCIFGGNNVSALTAFANHVTDFISANNGFYHCTPEQKSAIMESMPVLEQLWASCFIQNELGVKLDFALEEEMVVNNQPASDVKITHLHGLKLLAQNNPGNVELAQIFNKVNTRLFELAPKVSAAIYAYGQVPELELGANNDSTVTNEPAHN